ncbi:MAG: sugar phosphate isomerase/epimerase [Kiritimatiellae bacterium]|nr:sugar phosphate isomerase/epimerase [Kiritimatiellia bacterium]
MINRREFLMATAVAGVAAAVKAEPPAPVFKTQLKKALIRKRFTEEVLAELKAAKFPGVELMDKTVDLATARAARRLAEENGFKIHSFMGGWYEFNSADAAKRKIAIETAKRDVCVAEAYGAPVMLMVAGRVGGPMPKPSQFDLDFDPRTLELRRAAKTGDFAAYVKAQNDATKYAQDAVQEIMPVAAAHGVVLGLENVWNNLWVKPAFASAFIRSFRSPWVKSYFDLGNHVRYAPVEEWLAALSDQIVKLHIKDFKIDRSMGNEGKFVRLGEGSIDWKSVRRAIDAIGYNGWVSIEEGGWTSAEYSSIMDRFSAGTF